MRADPAEIMLAARAAAIAAHALAAVPARSPGIGAAIAAVEAAARTLGAEEIYIAAAPDLDRDLRLTRIEGEPALGAMFAIRASVAYKGSWVRRVRTYAHESANAGADPGARSDGDGDGGAAAETAALAFADAVSHLPSAAGLTRFESFLVEGCRTSQPLEPLIGSRIAEPRPPGPGAIVSVQACVRIGDRPILVGAPVLLGDAGAAASLLGWAG